MREDISNVDSTESTITEEQSGPPDEMAEVETDTQEPDHPEEGAEPAEEIVDPSEDAADENGTITDEEVTPPAEEKKSATPWDFALTNDSTALCAITDIIIDDDGDLLGDSDLMDEVDAFLSGETKFKSDIEELAKKYGWRFIQIWVDGDDFALKDEYYRDADIAWK